jgi:hypothetical protein
MFCRNANIQLPLWYLHLASLSSPFCPYPSGLPSISFLFIDIIPHRLRFDLEPGRRTANRDKTYFILSSPLESQGPRLLRTGCHHRFLKPCPPPHDPVRLHYTGLTTLPAYHTSQAPRGGLKREAQPRFRDRRGALYNHRINIMATRRRRNCARAS